MLTITGDRVKIWRNDRNGFASYYITISAKDPETGEYSVKAYQTVRFKKDVSVANGTMINVANAFPTVSRWKDGSTHIVWMITDFSVDEPIPDGYEGIDEGLPF